MRPQAPQPYPYPARQARPRPSAKALPAPAPETPATPATDEAGNPFIAMLAPLKRRRHAQARETAARVWAAKRK